MNMQAIGKKISALRKERDMTQVDLADKLGVTYQAVSSWERGNSMPDIGKLPDISQVLSVSIDELLDNTEATEIVKNVLSGQDSSSISPKLEALVDVAPILKPSQVNTLVKQSSDAMRESKIVVDGDMLVQLAQYMESEDLKEIALRCEDINTETIVGLANHLETDDLKEVALHCKNIDIVKIACYMESEDLKEVVLLCKSIDKKTLTTIAQYMESEDLVELIRK